MNLAQSTTKRRKCSFEWVYVTLKGCFVNLSTVRHRHLLCQIKISVTFELPAKNPSRHVKGDNSLILDINHSTR